MEIKKEPHRERHTSAPIVIDDDQHKLRHNSGPVKIKQEPRDFQEGCCMSGTEKSSSCQDWEGWNTHNIEPPVLEHSVQVPRLIATKSFPRLPLEASKGKPGTIFRDMLLNKVPSENTSEVIEKFKGNIAEKKFPPEVPLSSSVVTKNVPYVSAGTQNSDSQKPELQGISNGLAQKSVSGETTPISPSTSRDITPQASSSKWDPPAISSIIPQPGSCETDSDYSSVSDDSQAASRHSEMMALINDIIEAGRCLDLVNYRVCTIISCFCYKVVYLASGKWKNCHSGTTAGGWGVYSVELTQISLMKINIMFL